MDISDMISEALSIRPAGYFSKDGSRIDLIDDKKEIGKFLSPGIEQVAVYELKKDKTAMIINNANHIVYLAEGYVELGLIDYKQQYKLKKGSKFNIGKNIIQKASLTNLSNAAARLIAFSNMAGSSFFQRMDLTFELIEPLYVVKSADELGYAVHHASLRSYPRFSSSESSPEDSGSLKCVIEGCINAYWGKDRDEFIKGGKFSGESKISNSSKNPASVLMVSGRRS